MWRATSSASRRRRPEATAAMPWKDRYTISDERSVEDAAIRWPGGARGRGSTTADLSPPCGPAGITAADLRTPEAHYGAHRGLDGLLSVLADHGLRATFAVPAVIAEIRAARV